MTSEVETRTVPVGGGRELCQEIAGDPAGRPILVQPGDQGWWDDGAAKLTEWGFDLGGIRVPVKVWHGRQDRFVPVQHGRWLAASVPAAEAHISDRGGHLTMIGRAGEIHDWLLERF